MKLLIVLYHRFELWNTPPWFLLRLQEEFPEIEIELLDRYENVEKHIEDAEVVIAWSLRPEQFAAARKLRWVHSPAAAVHQLLFPEMVNSNVVLTNARQVHGPVVAEHVIAQIFALAKNIPESVKMQQKRIWGQERMWKEQRRPREVSGETLGLIGLGNIGREVAKRACAMGMKVIAVREHPENGLAEGVSEVFPPSAICDVLSRSDYVVLAAPLIESTQALMNAERIAQMKPAAYLINVSRGPLVDDAALIAALRQKSIAGAALDVFTKEPLPDDSPYWDLENVLITPHTAAVTERLWDRHYDLISENLERYLSGKSLLAVVDKQRGY